MDELSPLTAISAVDGRYASKTRELARFFSEFGLIRYRVQVELAWFEALAGQPGMPEFPALDADTRAWIAALAEDFDAARAQRVKDIEKTTNHDVKAVEYYLAERFAERSGLAGLTGFIHFACTSEDINNLAYGLLIRDARNTTLAPLFDAVDRMISELASRHAGLAMMSRTHGQAATPTTLGKEMANVAARLRRQADQVMGVRPMGKFNGAVGNFNAHRVAGPDVDWPDLSRRFVHGLGLEHNPLTTQIEPHDWMAELFHALVRYQTIALDLCRDIWSYISLGYFTQKLVEGEVGSSTMPHKVNPIDFENAEGNFGTSNALLGQLAEKLCVSRMQRDLSDSTAQRTIGTAFGHSVIALKSLLKGLGKLQVDPRRFAADLDDAWELLAEPVQTAMRRYGVENPYEKLKSLTRGKAVTAESLHALISSLDIPADARRALLELTPADYTGYAETLAGSLGDPD